MKTRMQSIAKKTFLEIETNPAFEFCSFRFVAYSEAAEKFNILFAVHVPKDASFVSTLRDVANVIEQKMQLKPASNQLSIELDRKEVRQHEEA